MELLRRGYLESLIKCLSESELISEIRRNVETPQPLYHPQLCISEPSILGQDVTEDSVLIRNLETENPEPAQNNSTIQSPPNGSQRFLNFLSPSQIKERIKSDSQMRKDILQSRLAKVSKRPLTYANHDTLISKLKADKIWYVMGKPEMNGHCRKLPKLYGVKPSTFKDWNAKLQKDPNWEGPCHKKSRSGYVFSEIQEEKLFNLVSRIIKMRQPMTNYLFRRIACEFYNSIPEKDRQQPNLDFNSSDKYIRDFRQRHKLSRRRAHPKRRTDTDEAEINAFRQRILDLKEHVPHDHILNTDETFWKSDQFNFYTWAPYGADDIIINRDSNEKAGFTTLATISLGGQKFPLIHIAKGKTKRVENSWFGPGKSISTQSPETVSQDQSCFSDHSESGWTNHDTWVHYLELVRTNYVPVIEGTDLMDEVNRIYLISDSYSVHNNSKAVEKAALLNIELIRIPSGATDACQPLDCRIFGVLKAKARAHTTKNISDHIFGFFDAKSCTLSDGMTPPPKMDRSQAMNLLNKIWDDLTQVIE